MLGGVDFSLPYDKTVCAIYTGFWHEKWTYYHHEFYEPCLKRLVRPSAAPSDGGGTAAVSNGLARRQIGLDLDLRGF